MRCQAVGRTDTEHVWPILDAALREYGLPLVLRSDNGPPFASTGAGGLSRLAVLVIKAGVRPERIAPGKPQQNGRHERLHLTLLRDAASPPARSLRQQLAVCTPSSGSTTRSVRTRRSATPRRPTHYRASPRRWDGVLREPGYSAEHRLRRVRHNGEIKWHGTTIYVHEALAASRSGWSRATTGRFVVCYGPIELGVIDHRGDRLRRPTPPSPWICGQPARVTPNPTGAPAPRRDVNKP